MRATNVNVLARVGLPVVAATLLSWALSPATARAADGRGQATPATPAAPAAPARGPATRPADPDQAVAAQLALSLKEVRFDGVALSDGLDFLRDVTKMNLAVDWAGLEASGVARTARVTVTLRNVKAADALTRILAAADKSSTEKGHRPTAWDRIGGVVLVAPPGHMHRAFVPAPALAAKARDEKSRAALARVLPELNFNGVALGDVLDFFKTVTGVPVEADWDKLADAGLKRDTAVTLQLNDVPAGRALNLILFTAGSTKSVDFSAQDGRVTIFPAEPPKGAAGGGPRKP